MALQKVLGKENTACVLLCTLKYGAHVCILYCRAWCGLEGSSGHERVETSTNTESWSRNRGHGLPFPFHLSRNGRATPSVIAHRMLHRVIKFEL